MASISAWEAVVTTALAIRRAGRRASKPGLRRRLRRFGSGLASVLVAQTSFAAHASAAWIDFEAAVPDSAQQQSYNGDDPPYVEDGMTVGWDETYGYLIANNPAQDMIGNQPDPGSKFMSSIGVIGPESIGDTVGYMRFDRADAQPFRIVSLEISEYSLAFDDPTEIHFVGTTPGGLVEQVFVTDGTNDGAGPLDDFELVLLGSEFTNLLSFEILGVSSAAASHALFAVDDVSFALVPEPSTCLLLAIGLAALTRRSRALRLARAEPGIRARDPVIR
jgi:hypothetical protein